MGGRGSASHATGGSGGGGAGAGGAGGSANTKFHLANAHEVAAFHAVDAAYDSVMKSAQQYYISAVPLANGYSFSQNLNHSLHNNGPDGLTAQQSKVYKAMMQNMSEIGSNLILNRADHSGTIDKILGMSYESLSDAQLNAKLTGAVFKEDRFLSTAYDKAKNPFSNGGPVSGGREVYLNIRAPSWTPAVIGALNQAELVLKPGLKYRITGAHYNGEYAYPNHGGIKKRIVVDVEIIP